ncbi:MAG: hypothetical protein JSV19_11850 [Phycisphaerales bacterium]|nr:MAG: hypothetical protein JSV19_11850 [Phycisphaerales bacterium]
MPSARGAFPWFWPLCTLAVSSAVQARTIDFAGLTWTVRSGYGGPGPNNWSDSTDSVWGDVQGRPHLKIRFGWLAPCLDGAGVPVTPEGLCADRDQDGDADLYDFTSFHAAFSPADGLYRTAAADFAGLIPQNTATLPIAEAQLRDPGLEIRVLLRNLNRDTGDPTGKVRLRVDTVSARP